MVDGSHLRRPWHYWGLYQSRMSLALLGLLWFAAHPHQDWAHSHLQRERPPLVDGSPLLGRVASHWKAFKRVGLSSAQQEACKKAWRCVH
jgi:hypothetical protein